MSNEEIITKDLESEQSVESFSESSEVSQEVIVESKSEGVAEQFKAQLIQSLEINDKLITELERKEKEISLFKQLQESLEAVAQEKDVIIEQLKSQTQELRMSQFNEKKDIIFKKWISKFNIASEQYDSVHMMLSKFTSEDELANVERMLENSVVKRQSNPISLTQTSSQIENTVFKEEPSMVNATPQQKVDALYQKLKQYT